MRVKSRRAVRWEGRALFLPAEFEVQFLHPYAGIGLAILRFDTTGATGPEPVRCYECLIVPDESATLRALPLRTLTRYAIAAAARATPEEIAAAPKAAYGTTVDRRRLQQHFDTLIRRPVGRPPLNVDLRHVAQVARAGRPRHVQAVVDAYKDRFVSRRTAQRWIKRAEQSGFQTR